MRRDLLQTLPINQPLQFNLNNLTPDHEENSEMAMRHETPMEVSFETAPDLVENFSVVDVQLHQDDTQVFVNKIQTTMIFFVKFNVEIFIWPIVFHYDSCSHF